MTDIATLGVRVTQDGVRETDASLKSMSQSGAAAEKSVDSLGKASKRAGKTAADAMKEARLSAAQTTMAFRQLPMQMTDVFTGLTSGQSPLQVLIQQGGQLKDSFGGVGAASRAVGGYVLGMVNPLTLAAAAMAGLSLAALQGSRETENLANALALSGNRIGATTSELVGMARDIAESTGGTIGKASEAIGVLAQMGATTKGQLSDATKAAIAYEKATGQALDETAKQFKAIQDGPTKAITELNKQYNFLTPATYKQIRAMEESGKKAQAAALATDEYTKALGKMSTDVQNNAGILERAWNGIAGAAKGAWDAMLGLGRTTTPADRIKKLGADLDQLMAWTPRNEKDNARRLESIRKIGNELDTLISKQVEEERSAQASAANARGVEATAAAMDKAAKNAQNYKQALRELTEAYITAADQVLAYKSLDEQALDATVARTEALEKEADAFRKIANPMADVEEKLKRIEYLRNQTNLNGSPFLDSETAEKASKAVTEQNKQLQKTDDIAKQLGLTFTSAFEDAIAGGKGFQAVLEGLLQDMIKLGARKTVTEPLLKALDGFSLSGSSLFQSFMPGATDGSSVVDLGGSIDAFLAGFRADGGPVSAGKRYVVGERGPELFVPSGPGSIVPNHALGAPNVTVNVTNKVSGAEVSTGQARMGPNGLELEVMIDQAVSRRASTPGSAMDRTLSGRGARAPLVQR